MHWVVTSDLMEPWPSTCLEKMHFSLFFLGWLPVLWDIRAHYWLAAQLTQEGDAFVNTSSLLENLSPQSRQSWTLFLVLILTFLCQSTLILQNYPTSRPADSCSSQSGLPLDYNQASPFSHLSSSSPPQLSPPPIGAPCCEPLPSTKR